MIACAISVLEFAWRYKKLESKSNVKHIDMVRRGLTQTNTNVFNIGKHHEHEICDGGAYSQVQQFQAVSKYFLGKKS